MNFRRTARHVHQGTAPHHCATPRSLAMALAMPVMMLLLFGYALSLDVDHIPTLIYDQDGTAASRDLIAPVPGLALSSTSAAYVDDYRDIERAIDRSRILMGIVIPRDYSPSI